MWLLYACDRGDPADALKPDPAAREIVRQWTRAPGGSWSLDPTPIAWSWSSLHAAVIGEELVLAGLNRTHEIQPWESRWRHFFVDALVSRDGQHWSARRYWGEGEEGGVDPAFVEDDRGWGAWVVNVPGTSGDPADPGRVAQLLRAPLHGTSLGRPELWATTKAAVDVAPVRFGGKLHVYATSLSSRIVEVFPDGHHELVWQGATVPYPRVVDGALELVAQQVVPGEVREETVLVNGLPRINRLKGEDRRLPHRRRSLDGRSWSAPELLAEDPSVRNCASPVLVDFAGLERLFCVDERAGGPGATPGAPGPAAPGTAGPSGTQ